MTDSLFVSILYATGRKLYWKFREPLKRAIDKTIIHFSKFKGIEIDQERFEKLLKGEIAENEFEAFKKGEKFIDGEWVMLAQEDVPQEDVPKDTASGKPKMTAADRMDFYRKQAGWPQLRRD